MTPTSIFKPLLALAILGLPMTAAAAEPVTMTCTGARTVRDAASGAALSQDVSFQVTIDADARRLVQDGQVMVIREWSSRRIVYSDFNPGLLGTLANGVVYTLDRTTGAWRDKRGSGSCRLVRG